MSQNNLSASQTNLDKTAFLKEASAIVLAEVLSHKVGNDPCFPKHVLTLKPLTILKGSFQKDTIVDYTYTSIAGGRDCGEITFANRNIAQRDRVGQKIIFTFVKKRVFYNDAGVTATFDLDDPRVTKFLK